MPDRYETHLSNFVPKVGRSVVVLGIIRPAGLQVIFVEWFLFVQPYNDLIKYYASGVANNLLDSEEMELAHFAITEEQLIDAAKANAKIVLNSIQARIYEDTQDLEALNDTEFAPAPDDLIRDMWIHGRPSARARIKQMKEATRCEELTDFLRSVIAIESFHTTDGGSA